MQRLVVNLFVMLVGCLVVPASLNAEDAEDCINRGIACHDKGEYDKAITAFTEATRLDPKNERAHALRGIARAKKGEYDKALADYNQVLKLNPKDSIAHYVRGNIYLDKGEYDKAIADLDQALTINPKYASAYYNRGRAWMANSDNDRAVADFNEAVAINPKFAPAFNSLAWLQSTCPDKKYRDAKKAIENASKAYQLDGGKSWGCLDTLAAAYAESGDFERAKGLEAKAIEMVADEKDKQACRSRLELYKQGKPYREEPKKK